MVTLVNAKNGDPHHTMRIFYLNFKKTQVSNSSFKIQKLKRFIYVPLHQIIILWN